MTSVTTDDRAARPFWKHPAFKGGVILLSCVLLSILVIGGSRVIATANGGGVSENALRTGRATISDCSGSKVGGRWKCTAPNIVWEGKLIPGLDLRVQHPPYGVISNKDLTGATVAVTSHRSQGGWGKVNFEVYDEVIVAEGTPIGSRFWDGFAVFAPAVVLTLVFGGALFALWWREGAGPRRWRLQRSLSRRAARGLPDA